MKALTVRQPWATLIVMGIKQIENRSWPTNYRGDLLIHAGKANDKRAMQAGERLCRKYGVPFPTEFPRGCYVGMVTLSGLVNVEGRDVVSDLDWLTLEDLRGYHFNSYGFVLTKPHTMPVIPANGQLKLFEPGEDIITKVEEFIKAGKMILSTPEIIDPAPSKMFGKAIVGRYALRKKGRTGGNNGKMLDHLRKILPELRMLDRN